jgi:uncharacterized iron-regulated membrane protein
LEAPAALRQSRRRRRAGWRWLHLWLGLSLGLPLALIGLSGSVLVFWQELDAALNPGLFRVAPQNTPPAPLERNDTGALLAAVLDRGDLEAARGALSRQSSPAWATPCGPTSRATGG